ncbi:MAG: hypothetical protein QXD77_03465 [Candidatus Aenigmatarchaeota archaeon]
MLAWAKKLINDLYSVGKKGLIAGALAAAAAGGCGKHSEGPVPNYWMQVYDEAGNPAAGVPVSVYPAETYDPLTGAGDYAALQPKAQPDAYSDANGRVGLVLPYGAKSHIVIGTACEREFNRQPNTPIDPNGNDEDVYPFCPADPFNAEGHIKYQENGNNKYTAGDIVTFYMFGVNNGSNDETVSYAVVDLRNGGNPRSAPVVYRGDFSNPDERLTVPAGLKEHKVMHYPIPLLPEGKYAIFVTWPGFDWNNDGTPDPWHRIGNFFVVPDTTPPVVYGIDSVETFTNEGAEIYYSTHDPAQPGTVRILAYDISSLSDNDEVVVDTDISYDSDGDGDPTNDADLIWTQPSLLPPYGEVLPLAEHLRPHPRGPPNPDYATADVLAYVGKNAKTYTIRIWKTDMSGNKAHKDVQVTVHLTKAEADALADPIYDQFKIGATYDAEYFTDFNSWQSAAAVPHFVRCNKHNDSYTVGHNYNRQGGLTEEQAADDEAVIAQIRGPPFAKPILRSTKSDFVTTLTNYLQWLKDNGRLPP